MFISCFKTFFYNVIRQRSNSATCKENERNLVIENSQPNSSRTKNSSSRIQKPLMTLPNLTDNVSSTSDCIINYHDSSVILNQLDQLMQGSSNEPQKSNQTSIEDQIENLKKNNQGLRQQLIQIAKHNQKLETAKIMNDIHANSYQQSSSKMSDSVIIKINQHSSSSNDHNTNTRYSTNNTSSGLATHNSSVTHHHDLIYPTLSSSKTGSNEDSKSSSTKNKNEAISKNNLTTDSANSQQHLLTTTDSSTRDSNERVKRYECDYWIDCFLCVCLCLYYCLFISTAYMFLKFLLDKRSHSFYCPQSFYRKDELRRHTRCKHTKEKKFFCPCRSVHNYRKK